MADERHLDGVRLGIDVGKARVGLAATDPAGIMATPVKTLKRDLQNFGDLNYVFSVIRDRSAVRVYIGDPVNLRGNFTESTTDARDYALRLANMLMAEQIPCEVRLVDERLSTVSAARVLHQAGRSSRAQRSVIDQVAAVEILEHALTLEKAQGAQRVGTPVEPEPAPQQLQDETTEETPLDG